MNLLPLALSLGERLPLPDFATRRVIDHLVGRTHASLQPDRASADARFAREMTAFPIASHTAAANAQHYELPADFFSAVLGPRLKYSCCWFADEKTPLAVAEEAALQATVEHAALADGQRILELGCGWGSLSLWMAAHYPNASIVAVSNSQSQRRFITHQADVAGLRNLTVVTADMNEFVPEGQFDRIVSVEMFEHMSNWRALLTRLRNCLSPDGRAFLHVFTHRDAPYRFDHNNKGDWIAQHFFTGGVMPSHNFIRQFSDLFSVEAEWRWSGLHYERTAEAWLKNYDACETEVRKSLIETYGTNWRIWHRRWRLFFLATMGLFGHAEGEIWSVSHYRLAPTS
ncbi:MAG: class I SAM-dependent methyltransferase [Methylobacteriaceae bacterium]|nr:class I SAM-dependent methyltransferase [Methylobacteriaceae bacterium]